MHSSFSLLDSLNDQWGTVVSRGLGDMWVYAQVGSGMWAWYVGGNHRSGQREAYRECFRSLTTSGDNSNRFLCENANRQDEVRGQGRKLRV